MVKNSYRAISAANVVSCERHWHGHAVSDLVRPLRQEHCQEEQEVARWHPPRSADGVALGSHAQDGDRRCARRGEVYGCRPDPSCLPTTPPRRSQGNVPSGVLCEGGEFALELYLVQVDGLANGQSALPSSSAPAEASTNVRSGFRRPVTQPFQRPAQGCTGRWRKHAS